MAIKLDMGRAWNDAVAMLTANRDMVLVIAGVFFLLPNLAMSLFAAQPPVAADPPAGADPQQVLAQLTAELGTWFADVWWLFVLIGLAQAVGTIGLLALFTDRSRPTVGEALGFGVRALPTYIATQLMAAAAFVALFALVGLIGSAVPAAGIILALLLAVFAVYAMIKLALVTPVIAIDKELNPLAALQRSWRLSKGNSLLIFAFFLLIMVVALVISAVAGIVLMAFTMLGEEVGLIAGAVGNGVLTMVLVSVMVAALAAVHRQLAGGAGVGGTFA